MIFVKSLNGKSQDNTTRSTYWPLNQTVGCRPNILRNYDVAHLKYLLILYFKWFKLLNDRKILPKA